MPAAATEATPSYHNHVVVDGYLIQRHRILGTTIWVHTAWAPVEKPFSGPYVEITHAQDRWWGKLGTERNLPADLEALPALSVERYQAVRAHQDARYARAYELIVRAFPEAAGGRRSMGEISLDVG